PVSPRRGCPAWRFLARNPTAGSGISSGASFQRTFPVRPPRPAVLLWSVHPPEPGTPPGRDRRRGPPRPRAPRRPPPDRSPVGGGHGGDRAVGDQSGLKLKVCPPIEASSISPCSPSVSTCTPSRYCAFAPDPAVSPTAVACPANLTFPVLKSSSAVLFSNAMISVYV